MKPPLGTWEVIPVGNSIRKLKRVAIRD
jgi:hypothetical protein